MKQKQPKKVTVTFRNQDYRRVVNHCKIIGSSVAAFLRVTALSAITPAQEVEIKHAKTG